MNVGGLWITFDRPWYLLLLALAPLLWWLGRNSLTGLGAFRRVVVYGLRTAVLLLLVLALAELQWVRQSHRLTVIYLLDQSLSIDVAQRQAMIRYVNTAVERHRDGEDRAGVIVFGRDASVEIPPFHEDVRIEDRIASLLDPEYTNLAGAIKLAQASFPEGSSKRIVIVSDGNQNLGDALQQARAAAAAGVGIDVVPVSFESSGEVAVERVVLPQDVRKGTPFDLRVVLNNAGPADSAPVKGRLIVSERTDDQPTVLSDQPIELPPGKRVFTLREQIDQPNFYNYEARFVPDDPAQDRLSQNNRATANTHVRGSGQVLLIEDYEHEGEHTHLVARLRSENLEVTIRPSNQLFASLTELQPYDTVVLANVPREHFTDEQVTMLVTNTHDMGAGLIMLGGPSSFGAGGWAETELEVAMPVDFEIKNLKVAPSGALMLVIDCSGSMTGDKLEMSIAAAIAAVKVLGERDQVGVVRFESDAQTVVPMQRVGTRRAIIQQISRLAGGGGTNMMPGMIEGYRGLNKAESSIRHMIVLTDGQTAGSGYEDIAADNFKRGITTTGVAVGADAAATLLESISRAGGGKCYVVHDPKAIPRIFMKEARRVARPLIHENAAGFKPHAQGGHSILNGIGDSLPPLTGFVMTTIKQNPLVELSIRSPEPDMADNTAILATWTYGLGKTAAWTTDVGARWAGNWDQWENYDKLFGQLVRWSMRPAGEDSRYVISTDVSDGKVNVVVTATNPDDDFVNFLDVAGAVVAPDMKRQSLKLEQTAPGRYAGSFNVLEAGSYFVVLGSGAGQPAIRTGVNVPYSPEFRDRGTNDALLVQMAQLHADDAPSGVVIRDAGGFAAPEKLLATNSFRHDLPDARSASDIWPPILWLAGLVFLGDVFVRRVQVSMSWLPVAAKKLRDRMLGRQKVDAPVHLDRLRSRKQAVTESLAARRASTTYEPPASAPAELPIEGSNATAPVVERPQVKPVAEPAAAPEDYTSRLLKAKKRVWEDRDKPS